MRVLRFVKGHVDADAEYLQVDTSTLFNMLLIPVKKMCDNCRRARRNVDVVPHNVHMIEVQP